MRFQGVKIIDVIERNRLPKNGVAFEPGDVEVDFACVFPTFLWAREKVFGPAGASTMPPGPPLCTRIIARIPVGLCGWS